jgi:MFS family permease
VFVGVSFTLMAIPMILLAPILGRLVDRRAPRLVGLLSMAAIIPGLLGYGFLGTPPLLAIAAVVHAVGIAALAPAAAALVAVGSPPQMVARGQGLLEAFGFIAAAVASFPSGWAYETIGRGSWFSALAAVAAGVFVVGWSVAGPPPSTEERSRQRTPTGSS